MNVRSVHLFAGRGKRNSVVSRERAVATQSPTVLADGVALLQVRDGKWVRVHPKKKATFDCDSKRTSVRVELE
jgi:hypothetical protein